MSEMSAEKKKQIENYIVNSYFGGCKNVKPYIGGVDLVSGSCDIPDLLVEVESFNGELISVRWNVRSESESVWENEFMMVLARERKTERNRCDSVDAMTYAWESWKSKIQGKPIFLKTNDEDLQKDKRIEEREKEISEWKHRYDDVSVRNEKLEKEVKDLRAEKEVMERHIQELESQNVSLAETNAVLNNKLNKLDPMPEFKELLKKLYSTDDVEKLAWTLNHICGGRGSVNGWIDVSSFWKQHYETLSKLVGFSSVEEIEDYLVNESESDTLNEAISKLKDEVKYTCDEWMSANSRNNSWKAAAECNSPRELIEKLNLLHDDICGRSAVIVSYERDIEKWREETGCPSPSAAKNLINGLEKAVRLTDTTMLNELESNIDEWQKATGCDSPEEANKKLASYEGRLDSAKQSASIAIRHLDNIVFRDDKRKDWSDK